MDKDLVQTCQKEVNEGIRFLQQSDKIRAGKYLMEGLKCAENILEPREKHEQLSMLALLFEMLGFYDLSLMAFQQAIELNTQLKDENLLAKDLLHIGNAITSLGKFQKAEEIFRRALPIFLKNNSYDDLACTLTNIGQIMANQGRFLESVDMFKKSLEYLQEEPFPDTEFTTRMKLIEGLGLSQLEPETVIENAKILYSKFENRMHSPDIKVLHKFIDEAITKYLQKNPQLDSQTWKQRECPWLFKAKSKNLP